MAIEYRFVSFACLEPVCSDGQLLMDLYVNYDCDPDRSDTVLLERMFKGLINTINNPESLQDVSAANPMTTLQRNELRYRALGCVTGMLRAFYKWHSAVSGALPTVSYLCGVLVAQISSACPWLSSCAVGIQAAEDISLHIV